jgi:PE family
MSFVIATPELVQGAAQGLAGIQSSLAEATTTAAGPTTGIAAAAQDEVSLAIASMFGNFGQEFQALSAQAQAFHAQFVTAMNGGAAAYVGAEAANAGQTLLGGGVLGNIGQNISGALTAIQNVSVGAQVSVQIQADLQAFSGAMAGAPAGAPTLIQGFNSFGATVAAPYQALVANTVPNLQSLGSAIIANPAPFLSQLGTNQIGYAQTFGTGLATALQNFPATLANVPANVQLAIQGASTFNPGALAQQFITQQQGYAFTIGSSLQLAGQDFNTAVQALPGSFQAAGQALMAGNVQGAADTLKQAFINLYLTGLNSTPVNAGGSLTITPGGTLGDLLPILSIPGQMAQNLTNLIPPGSIPAQISQNFTNVVNTLTDTGVTSTIALISDPNGLDGLGIGINATMGLPLVLGLEALGGPASGLNALGSSVTAFANAVQAGNGSAAAAAILDTPAVVANGFLNGQTTLPLSVTVNLDEVLFPTTLNIPLDGILAPAAPYTALVDGSNLFGPGVTINSTVTGTPISGILPGLLTFLPADFAAAIGGPPPVIPPVPNGF